MQNSFKEKIIEKKEPEAIKLKKLDLLSDFEHVEIKKLNFEDVDEVFKIMHKTLWEVSREQVADVIKAGMSYGAYVERMLVGAGLCWPTRFNEKSKTMVNGKPNALYLEDVALLLTYEGRGIRKMLIEEREKAAKANGFKYTLAYISPDWQRNGVLEDMINERGNKIEKAYFASGYKFIRTKDGILAVKKI